MRMLGRPGGKSVNPPCRLGTLMSNPLTRSSFRQEHKINSVGNGSVSDMVQEEKPHVGGAPEVRPRKTEILAKTQGIHPRGSAVRPNLLNDDLISCSSPQCTASDCLIGPISSRPVPRTWYLLLGRMAIYRRSLGSAASACSAPIPGIRNLRCLGPHPHGSY